MTMTKPTFSPAVLFLISVLAQSLIVNTPTPVPITCSGGTVSETSHFRALGVDTSFSCVLKWRSRGCVWWRPKRPVPKLAICPFWDVPNSDTRAAILCPVPNRRSRPKPLRLREPWRWLDTKVGLFLTDSGTLAGKLVTEGRGLRGTLII
ncbi:hypothetical protein F5141DRAFT_419497 [Pisolithus sp. B1]|nr:hypothetical protein F5141DRAFT_419497 [Pisolithus sp. B1]